MSEYRKIDDYSQAQEDAEYRAQELKEVSERDEELWNQLDFKIVAFESEKDKIKKQKILESILRLQNKIKKLEELQYQLAIGIGRSLISHDLGRDKLLNWKPISNKKN